MLNRKIQPKIVDAVDFNLHLKRYTNFALDNGVAVYAVNAPEQEVLMIEWLFFAGNCYEEKNMVSASANYLLKNGTRSKNAFAINEHFEFYGAYVNRHSHHETASLTLHSLSKHLQELLPLIAELLTDSIYPEDELAIYKQNQKQGLEVNLKKCEFVANRIIDENLYGFSHPYGKYTSMQDYDNLQRNDLNNFYNDFYINGKCALFIAGNLPSDIEQLLNKYFGSLNLNQNDLLAVDYKSNPSSNKKQNLVNDVNGVQAALRIARPFPNRHNPDFIKMQVLNNILGGYFGSRLMSNIREDKGYTYGIHSYLQNHIHETALMISTEAGRDVAKATMDEIYKEMEKLRNEIVDADELNLVRNYMIGSILGDIDGPFQIIARWKNYILNNLDADYFNKSIATIKKITAEELQTLANKYLQPEDFYELMVV